MVKRIPFHLAIFAVLLVAVVVLAAAGQAFRPSKMRAANLLLAPQMAAAPAPIQAVPLTTPAPQRAQAVKAFAVPEPAPTPARAKDPVGSPTVYRTATLILPVALMLVFLLAFIVLSKPQWTMSDGHLSQRRRAGRAAAMLFCLFLLGCQSQATVPLPPDDYLEQALDWLEANAVRADTVDWEAVRAQAVALAGQPQTTADTYAAITYAIEQLNDPEAFLTTPQREAFAGAGLGLTAVYPQNIIIEVMAGSPAAEAGIQVGDEVLNVNGHPPSSMELHPRQVDFLYDPLAAQSIALTLMRGSKQWEVAVSEDLFNSESHPARRVFPIGQKTAAYLELPFDPGTRLYPTHVQAAMAEVDSADTCGWILDLRNTRGGDLWTYFAALSPILGEGELGGFAYKDGSEETWRLDNGKVFWAGEEREESYVRGGHYELKQPSPPVALLTGPLTEAAGELVVVAFLGWGNVRTFGEPTLGAPHLILHTPLSDGARLFVSGARGMDRDGTVYNGPIIPDESVTIGWQHLGDDNDPVISAALNWLATQPTCKP